MTKSTYTSEGTFDHTKNAVINICIPREPSPAAYHVEMYNLSKKTAKGTINVIFCHFSNYSEVPISHQTYDYQMNFDINTLHEYPNATPFNENNEDALCLFFHNNEFNESDRDVYFEDVERLYEEVKKTGNQSGDGLFNPKINATLNNPRVVGLGLIKKLN